MLRLTGASLGRNPRLIFVVVKKDKIFAATLRLTFDAQFDACATDMNVWHRSMCIGFHARHFRAIALQNELADADGAHLNKRGSTRDSTCDEGFKLRNYQGARYVLSWRFEGVLGELGELWCLCRASILRELSSCIILRKCCCQFNSERSGPSPGVSSC